jgi:hypothetical protein
MKTPLLVFPLMVGWVVCWAENLPPGRVFDQDGNVVWQRSREDSLRKVPQEIPPPNINGRIIDNHKRQMDRVYEGTTSVPQVVISRGVYYPSCYQSRSCYPSYPSCPSCQSGRTCVGVYHSYSSTTLGVGVYNSTPTSYSSGWVGVGVERAFVVYSRPRTVTVREYHIGGSVSLGGCVSSGLTHSPGGRPVRRK